MEMGQRGGSSLMDRGNGSVREPDDGGETSAEPFHIRWGTLRSAEYRSELAYRNRRGVFHRSISFVRQTDLSETRLRASQFLNYITFTIQRRRKTSCWEPPRNLSISSFPRVQRSS